MPLQVAGATPNAHAGPSIQAAPPAAHCVRQMASQTVVDVDGVFPVPGRMASATMWSRELRAWLS
jgi:hypothetical protein